MATRQANIKIKLQRGSFRSGMRSMIGTVASAGRQMGKNLKDPMMGAVREVKKSMGGMFSTLKTGVKTAGAIGGGFLFGSMVKGAVEAEKSYISLGSQLTDFTGKQVSSADAQGLIESAAERSKGSMDDLFISAQQLIGVVDKIGMEGFEESLVRSSLQARRLGQDGERVARVYSRFIAKGIAESAEQAELLVERMNRFGRVTLGIDPDEAIDPNDMGELAAFIKQAGLNAEQAFILMESGGGDIMKDMGQATEFIEEFGNVLQDTATLGDLRKKLGIRAEDLNTSLGPIENLVAILQEGGKKGVDEMIASFGNERNQRMMRDLIGEGLIIDLEKGKKGAKQELKMRAGEIAEMLGEVGDATGDRARIEKTNAELLNTSESKLQEALNKMRKAFGSKEMTSAISQFADILPKIAKGLTKFMDFALKHPALTVGLALGGKAAISGVAGAAASVVGRVGVGLTEAAAVGLGRKMAWEFAATASTSGKWAAAGTMFGKTAGIGVAAAVAFAVGKAIIDSVIDAKAEKQKKDVSLQINAAQAKTVADKQEALKQLRVRETELKEGPAVVDSILGALASITPDFISGADGDTASAGMMNDEALAKNRAEIRELEAAIKKQKESSKTATTAQDQLAKSASNAAAALSKLGQAPPGSPGGGTPNRGPAPKLSNQSGAAPREQAQ